MGPFAVSVKKTVVSLQDRPEPNGLLGARLSRPDCVVMTAYLNGSVRMALQVGPPLRISAVARIRSRDDIAVPILNVEKRGNVASATLASHMGKEQSAFFPTQ
jgi:hypothetical protein